MTNALDIKRNGIIKGSKTSRSPSLDASTLTYTHQFSTIKEDELPASPSMVFAQGISEEKRKLHVRQQMHFQKKTIWRAHQQGVELFFQERLMGRRSDGKFEPLSAWNTVSTQQYSTSLSPQVTSGTIVSPAASSPEKNLSSNSSLSDAEKTLLCLPPSVQRSVTKHVAISTFFHGLVFKTSTVGKADFFEIELLRLNNAFATSVKAISNGKSWNVTQVNYSFSPTRKEVAR